MISKILSEYVNLINVGATENSINLLLLERRAYLCRLPSGMQVGMKLFRLG